MERERKVQWDWATAKITDDESQCDDFSCIETFTKDSEVDPSAEMK